MGKHILVPLDGTESAEAALAPAAYLARVFGARVTLLHVLEQHPAGTVHGERHLTGRDDAQRYLDETARRAFPPEARASGHVHAAPTRDVAGSLVAHEGELAPDLIVMCVHGRRGLHSLLFGTLAQQVVGTGCLPVLVVHPEPHGPRDAFACRTLLAPTDGDPAHAEGLAVAMEWARATGARLHLLAVVPTAGKLAGRDAATQLLMPGATQAVLEAQEENLRAYLQERLSLAGKAGATSASAEIRRGDPATVIAATAKACAADIIVLGTHGLAGSKGFWLHSVGSTLAARTRRPLLLVPVTRAAGEG